MPSIWFASSTLSGVTAISSSISHLHWFRFSSLLSIWASSNICLSCGLSSSNSSSDISVILVFCLYVALYTLETVGFMLFLTKYAFVSLDIFVRLFARSMASVPAFILSSVAGISYAFIWLTSMAASVWLPVMSVSCSMLRSSPYMDISTPAFASTAFILSVSVTMTS